MTKTVPAYAPRKDADKNPIWNLAGFALEQQDGAAIMRLFYAANARDGEASGARADSRAMRGARWRATGAGARDEGWRAEQRDAAS